VGLITPWNYPLLMATVRVGFVCAESWFEAWGFDRRLLYRLSCKQHATLCHAELAGT
jgi:hypothetical protein